MAPEESEVRPQQSLSTDAARQLATTTKTVPQMVGTTPQWLLRLLPWVQVESGTYRVNRRKITPFADAKIEVTVDGGKAVVKPEALRGVRLFASLPDKSIRSLAEKFQSEHVEIGQTVFQEGDDGDRFYIIAQGKIDVRVRGAHGETVRVNALMDGDYFGEMALLSDQPRSATLTALTPSTLVTLQKADFDDLLAEQPKVREILEETAAMLRQADANREESGEARIDMGAGHWGEQLLPDTFVDYDDSPREYNLSIVQTVLRVHTRVTDLYNQPIDQLREQLRLTVASMKERQEFEAINNPDFGLVHNVARNMRVPPRTGPPTPDDMDELLARVWKEPAFFLAHPAAIAAFGRECTRRGVPPPTVAIHGSPFLTWRGVPIVPCDKLLVDGKMRPTTLSGRSNILLMRVGEAKQGVVGLQQTGIPGEHLPSFSVRFMGIDQKALSAYLLTLYHSVAVLTDDALGMLEGVETGVHHDY